MKQYLSIRASQLLHQHELIELLKSLFPESVKQVGNVTLEGCKTYEVRILSTSPKLQEIRSFILTKREQEARGFAGYTIGRYLRSYTKDELRNADILYLRIAPHFEPAGEECGTIYKTLCPHCNLGRQMSDLILDLRCAPQHRDFAETIAWAEWIVSAKFVQAFVERHLSGAEFRPVFKFKNPMQSSQEWHQLEVIGRAGRVADGTLVGIDPFTPSEVSWRCPLGHSLAGQILSEVYLKREEWDGSDIAVTSSLFGQGRSLLRPTPLIIISQRMYRAMYEAGLRGYSVEVAHLV